MYVPIFCTVDGDGIDGIDGLNFSQELIKDDRKGQILLSVTYCFLGCTEAPVSVLCWNFITIYGGLGIE